MCFFDVDSGPKKSRKLGQGSPESVKPGHDNSAVVVVHAPRVPRAATRATKHEGKRYVERGKKGQKERRPVGKWTKGKVGTESWPEGTKRDLTRLWARAPANLMTTPSALFEG